MSSLISDTAVSLPAPALRPFITGYAGFRVSGLPPGVHFGLPSSDVDLIISLDRRIDVVQMPNSRQRPSAFKALVSGLQDAPAGVRQYSEVFGLHVFIKPLGVRSILGVPNAEISSLVLNLSDIWGNRARDLIEMLLAANTWHQRFAILDHVVHVRAQYVPGVQRVLDVNGPGALETRRRACGVCLRRTSCAPARRL